ncbi:hypothetical protein Tco_0277822 [Tanacetum coccineum]
MELYYRGCVCQGFLSFWGSLVFRGVLLRLIEGAEIMSNKFMTAQQEPVIMFEDDPQANQAGFKNSASEMANEGLGSSGWFDRLFGEKKEEVNVKTKVLESFDSLLWFE